MDTKAHLKMSFDLGIAVIRDIALNEKYKSPGCCFFIIIDQLLGWKGLVLNPL